MSLRRNLAATLAAVGICVLFLGAFLNARSAAYAEAAAGRRRAAEWDDRLLTLVTKVDGGLQSLGAKVDTVAAAQRSLDEKSAQLAKVVARQQQAEADSQQELAAFGVKQTQAVKKQFDKLALDRQFDREMHGQEHMNDAEAQAAAHDKLARQLEALLASLKQQRSSGGGVAPTQPPASAPPASPTPSESLQQRRRRRWRPNTVQLTSYSGAAGGGGEQGGGGGAGSASDSDAAEAEAAAPYRRDSVRRAIKRAWDAYATHALGADELDSVTNEAKNWDGGNQQMVTLVDALDTLYVAGLRDEFDAAVSHLEKHFRFTPSASVSVFETTIRLTGGLLSAYALSNRTVLLEKAIEVADVIAPVYTKESLAANNGMPYHGYNPSRGEGLRGYGTFLAEAGSVQLENRYLSHASGNATYDERASSFFGKFAEDAGDDGLVGNEWEATEARRWGGSQGTGARSDSYYEYLLKQHLLTETEAGVEAAAAGAGGFGELYVRAANGILSTLTKTYVDVKTRVRMAFSTSGVGLTASDGHTYYQPEQVAEHLSCFVPGMLALGSRHTAAGVMDTATRARHMAKAKEMTAFCAHQYLSSPTGLSGDAFAPELAAPSRAEVEAGATPEGATKVIRPNYGLRPETVESLFYMHRVTRDAEHREAGWKIFQAIEKHCRVCADCEVSGYSEVADATVGKETKVTHTGHMESFFLGETMKYLYLLFADDSVLDLDCWVFNTEAHPFPRLSKSLPAKCYRSPPSAMHEAGWSAAQT